MKCKIVARAAFDYDARTDEELTIREGSMLLVLDDSDPEWWLCQERDPNADAFQDGKQGLAPVNYLEEIEPKLIASALYDYEARTDEEISFFENATVLVYENEDPEWWFVRIDKEAGLAPANYLEASVNPAARPVTAVATVAGDAAEQKAVLLNTLDMFGVSASAPKKAEKEKAPPDVKLIVVFELDKKKKKERKECFIGIGNDYVIYLCEPIFSNVLEKWDFKQLSKFHEKKGKKVTLEFGSDVRDYEGEKDNLDKLVKRLEEVTTLSKVSGPILTGPPPNMGPPEGSLKGIPSFNDTPSPPPAPVFVAPPAPAFVTPSPAAQAASARLSQTGGKSAIALYDYEATNDEELTIREDEELVVLDASDDDWWMVRLVRRQGEGLVPKLYVEMKAGGAASSGNNGASADAEVQRRQQEEQQQRERERREREEDQRQQRLEADRRRVEETARHARMQEERRRAEEEANKKPALLARPSGSAAAPALPKRNDAPMSIPSAVPRLPERPAAPTSKPADEVKKTPTDKPNPAKVRKWVDKTGGFTVEAEFISVADGKVHLHKVNGVKIAVPLDKLAPTEIEFIRTLPGYSNISGGASVGVPTPGAARVRPGASNLLPATAYIYNGFDWRDWLLKAGIASSDAAEYATAFVREKLDRSVLDGIDRDVLKALGISEGDIIRIRKYASTAVASGAGFAVAQRAKLGSSEKIDQILADEQYARQLQEQELHGTAGTTSALLKGNRSRPTGAGINSQSILAATELLSKDRAGPVQRTGSQTNVNPWAGQNNSSFNSGVKAAPHSMSPTGSSSGLQNQLLNQQQQKAKDMLNQQQQLLNAQQQQALSAQKQAEAAALQLQQQKALAEQQTALAARKAAELEQQRRQLELAKVEAEKAAQLRVMKEETARLEAQLAEQKRLAALRPMQPSLIPTPSGGPSLAFVPVSGPVRPANNSFASMPNQMGAFQQQPGSFPQQGFQQQGFQQQGFQQGFQQQGFQSQPQQQANPGDRYAALKDLDPLSSNASSVFSSAGRQSSAPQLPPQPGGLNPMYQQQQLLQQPQGFGTNPSFNQGFAPQQQQMQSGFGGFQQGFQSMPMQLPQQQFQNQQGLGNLTPQQLLYLQQQQQQQQQQQY
ncbi:UNVERIFIED_CONTAM: cytoskeletal protein binding protein, partial [Siphonaria sp. JEL0065]